LGKFKSGRLLCFEEAFDEEKATYEKMNVGGEEVSNLLSYVFGFLVFVFLIHFLILQVCNDFVGEEHFDSRVGVINVVFNGVVGGSYVLRVHKFSIVVASKRCPFDILIRVPSFNCSVSVAFVDQEKIISPVLSVGSMD